MNMVIDIEDGLIDTPHYEPHKRGKNWIAKLDGKNAAHVDRSFWTRAEAGEYEVPGDLREGDAVEVGADYISYGNIRYPFRRYYNVVSISEGKLTLTPAETMSKAMKARPKVAA